MMMNGRIAWAGVAALVSVAAPAEAQDWTERGVITRVLSQGVEARTAAASSARASAVTLGAGLHDNPWIAWERQEAFDPNAQSQDLVRIILPVDFSGRRRAQRHLARVDEELAEAGSISARDDSIEVALATFYRAVAAELRVTVQREAVASLEEALRVMRSREEAGSASGYSASRLSLELEVARSAMREATLYAASVRMALASLTGDAPPEQVRGTLDVDMPESPEHLVEMARETRPELVALRRAAEAADDAADAARFAWVPRFELSAGYNRQFGPTLGRGYQVGAAAELPLFDRGQAERAEAAAAGAHLGAQRDALAARVVAQIVSEHARLVGLLAERERFREASEEPLTTLLRATESGYREGIRSVVELLDARRTAVAVREREVALALEARLSEVRLRRAVGTLR